MDLGTMLRVMIKRWYASVPALLMTIALPVVAWFAVPAKYTSTSTVSLLNSTAGSNVVGRTGNPLTSFDNSLTGAADFLSRTLGSDQAMADLAKRGVTDPAAAELAPNASGPFIILTITGKDPNHILAEMDTFDKYAAEQLDAIQKSTSQKPLPADTLIRSIVMVPPQTPVASMKSKLEDVAGAGVGGLVVLFVAVFGAEALAVRRGKPASVPPRSAEGTARPARTAPAARPSTPTAPATSSTPSIPAPSTPNGDTGSIARRTRPRSTPSSTPAPTPTPMETTVNLPRYQEPVTDDDPAPDPDSWIGSEPRPLEDFAVRDRDSGPR